MNIFKALFKRKPKTTPKQEEIQAPETMPGKTPIREYQMTELMGRAITVGEKTYVPLHMCVYDDSLFFEFTVHDCEDGETVDSHRMTKQSFTFPATDARLVPIEFEGIPFYWDMQDDAFRWHPRTAPETIREVNAWISGWDNGDLRIDKAYAEHNLSQKALAYAYKSDDAYYYWNMDDRSHFPVIYEIPGAFAEFFNTRTALDPDAISVINQISFYANSYSVDEPADFKEIIIQYSARKKKSLWTPDTKEEE